MRKPFALLAVIALLALGSIAQATVIIETVAVGDAGNAPDITGYGAVNHNYNIGKYEVTVGQYVEYLNWKEVDKSTPLLFQTANHISVTGEGTIASPYHYSVASGYENVAVTHVTFWDACRFVNWLCNSQGNGDTETGAYTLNGYDGSGGGSITRNPGAMWLLPTIDEWYKSAYYINDVSDIPSGGSGYRETVNDPASYGTENQYGDGWEWTESVVSVGSVDGRLLGGGYGPLDISVPVDFKGSSLGDPSKSGGPSVPWNPGIPLDDSMGFGFRVASVPEPSSVIALAGGLITLVGLRKRRA